MWNPLRPRPAPPAFGQHEHVPEQRASILSRISFDWLTPLMSVGFSRPLEKEDLWKLQDKFLTANVAKLVEASFYSRCPPEERPRFIRMDDDDLSAADEKAHDPSYPPSLRGELPGTTYDRSFLRALYTVYWGRWWLAGGIRLVTDVLKATTPLVTKVFLDWLSKTYAWHNADESARGEHPAGVGYGIALALVLCLMQELASLGMTHYIMVTMSTGLVVRTAVTGMVVRKSLRLSGRARNENSVGKITTLISADATRLAHSAAYIHNLYVSPIIIMLAFGLLISNLGYSALVGFSVMVLGTPMQGALVRIMFAQRKKGIKITDQRVRLTSEVLQGVRLLKCYAWETFYAHRIAALRGKEVATVRRMAIARSLMTAIVTFMPVLAAILSFVTYSLSGHQLDVATVFSSLMLFNVIRTPLRMLPIVLNSLSDTLIAASRISKFLCAQESDESYLVHADAKHAIQVDGDFAWETPRTDPAAGKSTRNAGRNKRFGFTRSEKRSLPRHVHELVGDIKSSEPEPYVLRDVKLTVPRGAFVAIVGKLGSGKSSLLQGMLGEMKRTRGSVVFGGKVSYAPQTAWIMNATVRENILFGREDDEARFRTIVQACALTHDLAALPHGEHTEIGEKGINLSGGQRARISLARAVYANTEVVLLDDCLSAVDAHTGKSLLNDCILTGPLRDKTRVLVTHALYVLDKADYIYVMDEGKIVEHGTFTVLREHGALFSKLMDEYGAEEQPQDADIAEEGKEKAAAPTPDRVDGTKDQTALMQKEGRSVGSIPVQSYIRFLRFAGSIWYGPLVILLLVIAQGAQVTNTIFLGWWSSPAAGPNGLTPTDYMGIYAALGIVQALSIFLVSFAINLICLLAGLHIFTVILDRVLHSAVSFFDTTPMGRIVSRLSKDQDTVDQDLAPITLQLVTVLMDILGTIVLVFYTFPQLGVIFAPLGVCYWGVSLFYRRTSVEVSRLDAIMRSSLYTSFSEMLTGLSTVRAYGEQDRFIAKSDQGLDMENRAYQMVIALPNWLGVRLELLGNILVVGVSMYAVGSRKTTNPAAVGVVLSYCINATQLCAQMVELFTNNEQNMNGVERLLEYTELPPEGPETVPNDPSFSWPNAGQITFRDVRLAYREGLPQVLKGVSFKISAGEKVGVVGRTGAGKSSLLQALFRMVEIQSGSIEIDGLNTRNLGLSTLRSRLALVPQECTLFQGTLRENLDPHGTRTDAELIEALQKSWLLPQAGRGDAAADMKFSLSSPIGDEGSNYSAGEKQLLALCRALVKNSRVIVLDEATSNVDVETDAKIQRTIKSEFGSATLLCIAHRLNTIAYYDRILVMDGGLVAEFDTPLNLFDRDSSIFRSLCDEAGLSRRDIVRIRAEMST